MNENAKRGAAAYQRFSNKHTAENDWLSRVAEDDFTASLSENQLKNSKRAGKDPDSGLFLDKDAPFLEKVTKKPSNLNEKTESKFRRVAKFLILIGSEQAAKVLENLDEEQVEQISREITSIRGINSEEAAEILSEFHSLLSGAFHYGGAAQGGVDEARRLLYAAFGPEKGETLLRRAVPQIDEGVFGFLEDFSGEQIISLLHDETPATGAMIFSRLDPKLSAAALSCADAEWRKETIRRIGKIGRVSPEVLEKVAESLREKARHVSSPATTNLDGTKALAAILKHTDISFGDKILGELAESDAELSKNIREKLFTLDDVVKADDKPIQEKLHSMSVKEIAVLIKGRPEDFTEKILSNISANRRTEIRAESDFIGPVTKKDSENAIKAFMEWFRTAREEGAILLLGDDLIE
jgi:flagellar motor switch protein FliG